jgi:hypothetical protein
MNFSVAKSSGAIDKKLEDQYNYLIDLLSRNFTGINATVPIVAISPNTVDGYMKFTNGILTEYVAPS